MWLRKKQSNEQAGIQNELKATTTNLIKKKTSNEQASIQQGHKATTTKVINKKRYPMSRPASNKSTRPQQTMWLRNTSSKELAGNQQEHKATTNNVIKKNFIKWAGWQPTRTQGHNNQCH